MKRVFAVFVSVSVLLLMPTEAAAQQQPTPAPSGPKPAIGVRAFFLYDANFMAASKTFDAVTGSSMLSGVGGGVDITNLWKGVFARVAFSRMSKDGERVVVEGDEVFPVGIPLKVSMTPVEIGAGWRFPAGRKMRAVPYAGAGLLRLGYKETADFAEPGDDSDESLSGSFVFGGVDVPIGKWLSAGVEGQYRVIKNAIGESGVSQAFGEDNLGGFTFRVLIGIRK